MIQVLKSIKGRPLMAILVACALVLAPIASGVAKADDALKTDQMCKLNLRLPASIQETIGSKQVSVNIYKVASIVATDGAAAYELTDEFAGIWETAPEIFSEQPSSTSNESGSSDEDSDGAQETSYEVSELVKAAQKKAADAKPIKTISVGADGASVDDLSCGLYLILPKKLNVEAMSLSPVASLVSLPTKAVVGDSKYYWSYVVNATLKMEAKALTGDLEIVKSLKTMNATLGNPTFVFHVVATATDDGLGFKSGDTVYDKVVSLSFDQAGKKSIKLEDIPAPSKIKVTEVYSGASYEVVGDSTKTTSITLDDFEAKVEFVNDYDDDSKYGTGVNNIFTFDDTANGYNVTQEPALKEQAQG